MKSTKINEGIGLKKKVSEDIRMYVEHLFVHENKPEDFVMKSVARKYGKGMERIWAGYVLGMVKADRIQKTEKKSEVMHDILHKLLGGNSISKRDVFNAVIAALAVSFMVVAGITMIVAMFNLGFTWGRLFAAIFDFAFAWLWYRLI
jgi:hypothetical protein